jgi:hypothetical protein
MRVKTEYERSLVLYAQDLDRDPLNIEEIYHIYI